MAANLWINPEDLGDEFSDLEYAQEACEAASQLLWALSGRRFSGIQSITELYLMRSREYENILVYVAGVGLSIVPDSYIIRPEDLRARRVLLRGTPVRSITQITDLEGNEIDPSEYHLVDHRFVVFPKRSGQDIFVTYEYGVEPNTYGKMAARTLAIQFALLWSGREDECTLPERVTSVTRQNVSWTILDSQDFIDNLRTGVPAIDMFLKSVNPSKALLKSKVFSPDVTRARHRIS